MYPPWLAAEGAARRVHWRLVERRKREWAALWRALTDLLPEDVVRARYSGVPAAGASRRRPALALFADLVGYTALWDGVRRRHAGDAEARRAGERGLVGLLHRVFSAFDREVALRRRLYKADSIGDAYIVVCLGGPDGGAPSAAGRGELLAAALAMQRAVARIDAEAAWDAGLRSVGQVRLRIGVAEGDVIAGLTGAHQQRYLFFGGAVTRAERHQRRARPGEVRVQAAVAAAAGDAFAFSAPGEGDGPEECAGEEEEDLVLVGGLGSKALP
jgi:class 3 adenylate cyclase